MLADGLSALALERQALPLFAALRARLVAEGDWTWAPPVVARTSSRGAGLASFKLSKGVSMGSLRRSNSPAISPAPPS